MKPLSIFLLLSASSLLAQTTTSDRLEITVIRSTNLKVEEAAFNLGVAAPSTVSFDTVIKALEVLGLKESDLQGVNPYFGPPSPVPQTVSRLVYNFTFRAASAQISETFQKFEQLRRSLLAGEAGLELVGQNLMGFGASDKSRDAARAQLTIDAIAEARVRADALAKAAGLQLGPIVGVTELPYYAVGPGVPPTAFASVNVMVRFATTR